MTFDDVWKNFEFFPEDKQIELTRAVLQKLAEHCDSEIAFHFWESDLPGIISELEADDTFGTEGMSL